MCEIVDDLMADLIFPELRDAVVPPDVWSSLPDDYDLRQEAVSVVLTARQAEMFASRSSSIAEQESDTGLLQDLTRNAFKGFIVSCTFFGKRCMNSS